MFESTIDRSMYDHPGKTTVMRYAVRRHRDRPALAAGESVTIVRMTFQETRYGLTPRVLIRTESGAERWVNGSDIEPLGDNENAAAFAQMGRIAASMLDR